MTSETYEKGMAARRAVLGAMYVGVPAANDGLKVARKVLAETL